MPANRKAQIERINQVSAMARTSWIALLGYLAFIGVTLLGVEDADFFVPSRQTQLPLINVSIPTASFFIFAPILAAALYIYLHIILLKLWDAIADANTPRLDGHPLADHLNPWLVNDWALTRKGPPYTPARPLLALGNAASFLLVWAAGPLVLLGFWWRSMPAHDEWLTLLLAACLLLSLHAALTSWRTARAWLSRPRREPTTRPWWRSPPTLAAILAIAAVSWLRTEGITDDLAGRLIDLGERLSGRPILANDDELATAMLARANLLGAEMVVLPQGWRIEKAARRAYRESWCREELDMSVCRGLPDPSGPSAQIMVERESWCVEHKILAGTVCGETFDALERRFASDWREERRSNIADLPQLDLSGRDLRRANGTGVALVGANLSGARLDGANFDVAQLEGATLNHAHLNRASLFAAHLEEAALTAVFGEADLREANLHGAYLGYAQLRGADLRRAYLRGATLWHAQLEGANLSEAVLEEADLDGTTLYRAALAQADMTKARITHADIRYSDLREANWANALTLQSLAQTADLRGAHALTQAQLDGLIGNESTLLPDSPAPDTGEPFYVWNCWETVPGKILYASRPVSDFEALLTELLCSPGNPRRKTGTPLPLDAPYPDGHPLAAVND